MSPLLATKALAIWFVILILAFLNGLFREAVLVPGLGSAAGLLLSGLLLCGLILAVSYAFLPWLGACSATQLVLIGSGWLVLTLIFEFAFGLLQGKSLVEILEAYVFKDGNIWPLVLLVTAASPWLAARLKGWV